MTDISNLKPGDSLTYEQAMALPDGARVSALWNNEDYRMYFTVGGKDPFIDPRKFGGSMLEREKYWNADQWHSVRLESLPGLPVWVITCDRCGTTYKNNERHACAAREPSEPSPGEGYRYLEPNVDTIHSTDEFLNTISGLWEATRPGFIGWVYSGNFAKMRRRIEPQAEPAKPERQASEIEKQAAKLYEQSTANSVESWLDKFGICDTLFTWHDELNRRMDEYRRVYDYAKSIGAIE